MPSSMTNEQVKAVIYVRLSEHKGEDDPSTSPDRQRQACVTYCEAQGWEIVEVVDSDLDVSGFIKGKRLGRPGIRRIIELLPVVDKVVFLKVDRLARSVSDFMVLADMAAEEGAALVSVKEGFDLGTQFGKAMAGILAIFAELESSTISDRVRDAKGYLKTAGRWAGGTVPAGYVSTANPDGNGWVLVIDPMAAGRIRDAAARIVEGRATMYGVAQEWSKLRTDGKSTSASTVRRIILSDAVCGRQAWPHILDPLTVRSLRKLYPERAKLGRRPRISRLLSGFLRCSTCQGHLHVGPSGQGGHPAYSCARPGCQRKVGINAQRADELLTDWFLAAHGDSRRVVQVDELLDDQAEIKSIQAAIQDTTDAMAAGGSLEYLVPKLQQLRSDLDQALAGPRRRKRKVVALGKTIAQEWADGDLHARRTLLTGEVDFIRVLPTGRGMRPSMARFNIMQRDHEEELAMLTP